MTPFFKKIPILVAMFFHLRILILTHVNFDSFPLNSFFPSVHSGLLFAETFSQIPSNPEISYLKVGHRKADWKLYVWVYVRYVHMCVWCVIYVCILWYVCVCEYMTCVCMSMCMACNRCECVCVCLCGMWMCVVDVYAWLCVCECVCWGRATWEEGGEDCWASLIIRSGRKPVFFRGEWSLGFGYQKSPDFIKDG